MSKVAVLCPTKDRQLLFSRMVDSVRATSSATVYAYLDEGQADAASFRYGVYRYSEVQDVKYLMGPHLGCAPAWEVLAREALKDGCECVACVTDDSVVPISCKGWDKWLLGEIGKFPGRIAAISACTNAEGARRVDQPAVSREWIEAVGFYAHPEMRHYCWPTVIGLLSEGLCLMHAPRERFEIVHTQAGGLNADFERDAVKLYQFLAWHYDEFKAALRRSIGNARPALSRGTNDRHLLHLSWQARRRNPPVADRMVVG